MAETRATNPLVAQFRRGGVARDLRLMAAQGLLPLKPEDLLEMWTGLVADPDEGVRGAAEASLTAFPVAELLPILKSRDTPPSVLGWAVSRRAEPELREAALQNHSLPDETIEQLAGTLPQALAELVVINQTRLLRRTSLLVALEANAGLSNDQKRRLRELRETFRIGEQPEPAAPAPAPAPEPPPVEPEPEVIPAGDIFMTEEEAVVRYLSEEERQQTEKVSAVQKIYRLNLAERLITALKGSREERAILIRDRDRLVRSAVLSSPRLTEVEIESFSAMKDVSDEVLRYIGGHREWTKRYAVLNNLVRNPRTPVGIALSMVPRLNPRDVKGIAGDRNSPKTAPKPARHVGESSRTPESSWIFTLEEQDLLLRLGGWLVVLARSSRRLENRLTADEREEIQSAIERIGAGLSGGELDELRACLDQAERAGLLLERNSKRSVDGSTAVPTVRPHRPLDDGWSSGALDLYRVLVRARLGERKCQDCSASLESASVLQANTRFGTLLNESQLSDTGAARLLAATDDLVVACGQCGARNVVPGERTA